MAGHEWEDWFEREEFIGQISDMRVQNLQVEREVVQKRTFTRWMNLHLEKCNPPIEVHDLFRDIQDGHILMALLEELSGCKLLHGFKKSSHRIFRLNNIAKVLSFLEERNVKLVSIDASDVADGNSSIILGLIWNIILFFQIKELTGNIRSQFPSSSSLSSIPTSSDSDASYCSTPSEERQTASTAMREHSKAIKKLLQWVQKRTRKYGVAVQDFGKSWTSGLAFLAVIKSIDPSLVDMRKALLRTARENLEDAFRIAHYSLGIPRLLEPEDLTINTPDEQSIIIYVSQFLEHFPGIEEDEQYRLIERSVSMCRLNYSDSDYMRNGTHRGRVRERSYMFERDSAQPPPKILISSVSEDRSTKSPSFRVSAARSWSSEDILADTEDLPRSVVKEAKEPSNEVLSNSTSKPQQLIYTQSPSSFSVPESVNTESLIGDSAISSPDSWVESEFGVTPEKFCESRSDSSLCDSGTAWDVYRATPVEIITLDDVPSNEEKTPDDQSISESYTDEGIYSLSSLESTQDRTQGTSENKQEEKVDNKESNVEKRDIALEQVQDQDEIKKDLQKDPDQEKKQEQSSGPHHGEERANFGGKDLLENDKTNASPLISITEPQDSLEELTKQTSVEESPHGELECHKKTVHFSETAQEVLINGPTESENVRNNVEVETECQSSPLEETTQESKEESGIEGVVEVKDKGREGVLNDSLNTQESTKTETGDTANKDEASKTSLASGVNIPVISISSEPEQHKDKGTSGQEGQDHVADDLHQEEKPGSRVTVKDVNSPQNPEELSRDSNDNHAEKPVEVSCSPESENATSEPIKGQESGPLDGTNEPGSIKSTNSDICTPDSVDIKNKNEDRQDLEPIIHESQTGSTDKDLTTETSEDAKSQHVNTKEEVGLTGQLDNHQDKLVDTILDSETTIKQQSAANSVDSKSNGKTGILSGETDGTSRDLIPTDFDRNSPTDDLLGDPIEPMDLFYPDKEEPMITEPPDSEMESWPSVLSVSPLQPAPASETLPDDQPLILLDDDFRNEEVTVQDNEKSITQTDQQTNKASKSQDACLLKTEELWGRDAVADHSEAKEPSSDSSRENMETVRIDSKSSIRQDEIQIPPVLRHRKGARLTESTNKMTPAGRNTDNTDSAVWWSDGWELYLLLLLWLLLYCFWMLPQMDLKSLPSLLLNL
ncbi:calmin [Cheilinus undulatus]|uniref:calmin n=1 Tax=Cheilinus undulatus TaxID=241271 RepID=UPI001BD3DFA4|nr:calmin [Cheilinus undulatus]